MPGAQPAPDEAVEAWQDGQTLMLGIAANRAAWVSCAAADCVDLAAWR